MTARTSALALLAIVALSAACDDKKGSAAAKELDRYANHDAAMAMAYLVDGIHSMDELRATDAAKPEVAAMLRTRTMPHLDKFLADAAGITPPKGNEHIHTKAIELATAYREAAAAMLAAAAAGDADGFASGHELMMSTTERFERWDVNFMSTIREHGVAVKPFPSLPATSISPPPTAPPAAAPSP
jgi:hypothetical protein